jgi:hypothetical protein
MGGAGKNRSVEFETLSLPRLQTMQIKTAWIEGSGSFIYKGVTIETLFRVEGAAFALYGSSPGDDTF